MGAESRLTRARRVLEQSPLNRPPRILDRKLGMIERTGRQKVAVIAGGYGCHEGPVDDPDWEVWAVNSIPVLDGKGRLRADLRFDIHQRCAQSPDDLDLIRTCPVPIFVPDDLLDAGDNTVAVPMSMLAFGFPGAPFACSFAYQIALAYLWGFKTIGLFGVELAWGPPRERTVEWASVSWWVGYMEAKGIKIVRPNGSRLGRHPYLYGIEYVEERDNTLEYLEIVEKHGEEIAG